VRIALTGTKADGGRGCLRTPGLSPWRCGELHQNGVMSKEPIVVCDPGVDDFLALLVMTGAGSLPRAVIGTGGNVTSEVAYRNAAGTMALLGLDCPVAKGVDSGLATSYPDTGDPFHGSDGLGGVASHLPGFPPRRTSRHRYRRSKAPSWPQEHSRSSRRHSAPETPSPRSSGWAAPSSAEAT
jgi:Inosine-uridine preferring nucleoside hydrolase